MFFAQKILLFFAPRPGTIADNRAKTVLYLPPSENGFGSLVARSTFTKPYFKIIVRSTMTTTQLDHLNI